MEQILQLEPKNELRFRGKSPLTRTSAALVPSDTEYPDGNTLIEYEPSPDNDESLRKSGLSVALRDATSESAGGG